MGLPYIAFIAIDNKSWSRFRRCCQQSSVVKASIYRSEPHTNGSTHCATNNTSHTGLSVDSKINPLSPCPIRSLLRVYLWNKLWLISHHKLRSIDFIVLSTSIIQFSSDRKKNRWGKESDNNIIRLTDQFFSFSSILFESCHTCCCYS